MVMIIKAMLWWSAFGYKQGSNVSELSRPLAGHWGAYHPDSSVTGTPEKRKRVLPLSGM